MSFISEKLEERIGRRNLLQISALAGASLFSGGLLAGCGGNDRSHRNSGGGANNGGNGVSETDVLNFALNLEYLEAEYYSLGVNGTRLSPAIVGDDSAPLLTPATTQVTFTDPAVGDLMTEIAADEAAHVVFLRNALSGAAVPRPAIDLLNSFNNAYNAAYALANNGTAPATPGFNPFASETAFLIGAFIFEDVGVTAYRGGSTLLSGGNLSYAAGILAVEGYHAAIARLKLSERATSPVANGLNVTETVQAISNLRDAASGNAAVGLGAADDDQGIYDTTAPLNSGANIVPTDANGLAFSRNPSQILNIVYLRAASGAPLSSGGFFPQGMNGTIRTVDLSQVPGGAAGPSA